MNRIKNSTIAKILTCQLITYLTCGYPINALAQEKGIKRAQQYIAVLDLRIGGKVPEEIKVPLTEKLQNEIINTRKYKVVDRAHRDQILKEQGFQLKDCVSSECIVEAGQLLGVGKIVTGSISKLGEAYYINAQLINVETGVVENSADAFCEGCSITELIYPTATVAKKLLGLPYTPYKPEKGVTRVPGEEITPSPITEMEKYEEFKKRYLGIRDTLESKNFKEAKQLSDELKNDISRYEDEVPKKDKKAAKKLNKLKENIKRTDKMIELRRLPF